MSEDRIRIRSADASQESHEIQGVAAEVSKILTPNEEILYIARQTNLALSLRKNAVVATSNRVIFYDAQILGRASFVDLLWQDVTLTELKQGTLSSEIQVGTADGRSAFMGQLDKDQAKSLYAVCQQMDFEWREKRRIRQMEEERARSGGVFLSAPPAAASGTGDERPVERLAKAKAMLEQGLISETEYEAVKAKILSDL
jgi:hypothetical protein